MSWWAIAATGCQGQYGHGAPMPVGAVGAAARIVAYDPSEEGVCRFNQGGLRFGHRQCGARGLPTRLLHGGGLRLLECLRLRVKDVDVSRREILVRDGKGQKDRVTMLPESLMPQMQVQMETVRQLHARDLANGHGEVWLPDALSVKYPGAARALGWQYMFPAAGFSSDPWSAQRNLALRRVRPQARLRNCDYFLGAQ